MDKETWNAWVWVQWKPGANTTAWEAWKDNNQIKWAWSTQGEWDACLCLDVNDHDSLENFVWKNIRNNEWVQNTRTMWAKNWW